MTTTFDSKLNLMVQMLNESNLNIAKVIPAIQFDTLFNDMVKMNSTLNKKHGDLEEKVKIICKI